MSPDPTDRYASMQELIFAMSPYNSGVTKELFIVMTSEHRGFIKASSNRVDIKKTDTVTLEQAPDKNNDTEIILLSKAKRPRKARKKRSIAFKVRAAVMSIIAVGVVYAAVNYIGARISIKYDDFKTANVFLNLLLLDEQLLPKDRAYVNAGIDLQGYNYDEAITAFSGFGKLYKSEELAKESNYEKAAFQANKNDFDSAIRLYQELGDYKDSINLVKESKYRKAAYITTLNDFDGAISLYRELGEYKDSAKLFGDTICGKGFVLIGQKEYTEGIDEIKLLKDINYPNYEDVTKNAYLQSAVSLMKDNILLYSYHYMELASGYKDADTQMNELKGKIYSKGLDYYHNFNSPMANIYLKTIIHYLDSDKYLTLCRFKDANSTFDTNSSSVMETLVPLIGFEDAAELLVSRYEIAKAFLEGYWKGDGYTLSMKKSGDMSSDIPFDYGYFTISDGYFCRIDKDWNIKSKYWRISVISQDKIEIFSYKNNRTYTLYRQ
jgi:tetratricopeptide (TPR) repeat protein